MMYNILLNFCAEKTLEMCEKAVDKDPRNLKYVPYSQAMKCVLKLLIDILRI